MHNTLAILAGLVETEDKLKSQLAKVQGEQRMAIRDNIHELVEVGVVKIEFNRRRLRQMTQPPERSVPAR